MSSNNNWVKIDFKSAAENIAFARTCGAAFASQFDCTLEDVEEIKMAISEAVSNSIIHGYSNEVDGMVTLEMKSLPDNKLEIVVKDLGCGIKDIGKALQPSYSSLDDRMGLGFVFMQSFMDQLEVISPMDGGTVVRMSRSFIPGVGGPDD